MNRSIFFLCLLMPVLFYATQTRLSLPERETQLAGKRGVARLELLLELCDAFSRSDPDRCIKYASEGLELTPKGKQQYRVKFLNRLGLGLFRKSRYAEAKQHVEEALKSAEALGMTEEVGRSRYVLGWVYSRTGDFSRALECAQESYKINVETDDKNGTARSLNLMGVTFYALNDLDNALTHYNRTLAIYGQIGNRSGHAVALSNIAIIYKARGDYAKALDFYDRALAVNRELDEPTSIANVLNNIGSVYYKMEDYHRALTYYLESAELYEKLNSRTGMAATLGNIGRCRWKLKQYKQALLLGHKSLALAVDSNSAQDLLEDYELLYEIYKETGDFKAALEFHVKFKTQKDLYFNEQNKRKITELQARFEVGKKEKTIALLKKDQDLKAMALAKQRNLRNFLILFSLLAMVSVFMVYNRYRLKVRGNAALRQEIDQRKRAENELLRTMKLESVGILAGGIAYDFRSLIGAFMENIAAALELMQQDPGTLRLLQNAHRASAQAAALARKLITFSDGGWMFRQEISNPLLLEHIKTNYPQLEPFCKNCSPPIDLKPVSGDERQLRQVFINLLENADEALKNVAGEKKVSIVARNVHLMEGNEAALPSGDYVQVSVSDNGPGIEPEMQTKIFDPYFSTKVDYSRKGMGLGLAICFSIIKKHKGHISVHSEPPNGTTFTVYLPASTMEPTSG